LSSANIANRISDRRSCRLRNNQWNDAAENKGSKFHDDDFESKVVKKVRQGTGTALVLAHGLMSTKLCGGGVNKKLFK
jgi:hypothetical protein